jgi:hypothetical protein
MDQTGIAKEIFKCKPQERNSWNARIEMVQRCRELFAGAEREEVQVKVKLWRPKELCEFQVPTFCRQSTDR